MNQQFYVYILQGSRTRYIGITTDIKKRIQQHNSGYSMFTKTQKDWTLQWISKPLSHAKALDLEKLLKRQKGGQGLQTLMNMHSSRGS